MADLLPFPPPVTGEREYLTIKEALELVEDGSDASWHIAAEMAGVEYIDVVQWIIDNRCDPAPAKEHRRG